MYFPIKARSTGHGGYNFNRSIFYDVEGVPLPIISYLTKTNPADCQIFQHLPTRENPNEQILLPCIELTHYHNANSTPVLATNFHGEGITRKTLTKMLNFVNTTKDIETIKNWKHERVCYFPPGIDPKINEKGYYDLDLYHPIIRVPEQIPESLTDPNMYGFAYFYGYGSGFILNNIFMSRKWPFSLPHISKWKKPTEPINFENIEIECGSFYIENTYEFQNGKEFLCIAGPTGVIIKAKVNDCVDYGYTSAGCHFRLGIK